MKKILMVLLVLTTIFTLSGCVNSIVEQKEKSVSINVYDKNSNLIYGKTIETTEIKLYDVIKGIEELVIKFEDSEYGKFITSMAEIDQGENFYWKYYVNGDYATVGISSQNIKDNDIYDFRIEKFE